MTGKLKVANSTAKGCNEVWDMPGSLALNFLEKKPWKNACSRLLITNSGSKAIRYEGEAPCRDPGKW